MKTSSGRSTRQGNHCRRVMLVMLLGCAASATAAWAQNPLTDVVRVEEDWELVIGEPDANTNAPQITCTISPFGSIDLGYAAFELNHRTEPAYASGGYQLHVWTPNSPVVVKSSPEKVMLTTPGETLTWTQTLNLTAGVLTFDVVNGSSTTWGAFGVPGQLSATVATPILNLNTYHSAVSVANSGVGFAGHRVQSLVLKSVRRYSLLGLLDENNMPQVVHPHQ